MEKSFEHRAAFTLIGFFTEIAPEEGPQKCPLFWDEAYNRRFARLWQTMQPQNELEQAILDNQIGLYAICAEQEHSFNYWIAGEYKGGAVPEGLSLYTFPESDWAIFTDRGPIPATLQRLNAAVWNEWYPVASQMYEPNGTATLEVYSAGNPQSPDYECGIRVPVKPKANLRICQSCGMPIQSDDVLGREQDGSINPDYCKYCYNNGQFIDQVSMETYIDMCSQFGAQAGMTNEEMKAHCSKLFPTLKRWKADKK